MLLLRFLKLASHAGLAFAVMSLSAAAEGTTAIASTNSDQNLFFLGGVYSSESVGETFNVIGTDYQDAYMLGSGYQQFFLGEENGFRAGLEGGVAIRKGPDVSGEAWAGIVLRSDGFIRNNHLKVSASVTGGLSLITNPLDVEVAREISRNGDSTFLFYMAPELSLSLADNPNVEYFWRVQHRSGGWNTLGNMGEGANANTVGIRWSF